MTMFPELEEKYNEYKDNIERMDRLRAKETNPVLREIETVFSATLQRYVDLVDGDTHEEIDRRYRAIVEAAVIRLKRISQETWDEWCEVKKEEFIPQWSNVWYAPLRMDKH